MPTAHSTPARPAILLTHPRFDRPPVANPHKRRRRGTIDLGKARRRREYMLATFGTLTPADDARPIQRKELKGDFPLGAKEWIPISIDGDIGVMRIIRALQSEGLQMTDGKIVDWPLDPEDIRVTDELRTLTNGLTDSELGEVLAYAKGVKARSGRPS